MIFFESRLAANLKNWTLNYFYTNNRIDCRNLKGTLKFILSLARSCFAHLCIEDHYRYPLLEDLLRKLFPATQFTFKGAAHAFGYRERETKDIIEKVKELLFELYHKHNRMHIFHSGLQQNIYLSI